MLTTPGPGFEPASPASIADPSLDPLFLRPQRMGVESAWFGHVPFAHWLIAACQPRVVVELGTHNGVSYSAFCEAITRFGPHGRAYAIDTWAGDEHAGHYGDEVFRELQRFHDERYRGFSEMLRCTFDEALPYFAEGSIDLLHIDGLHTYDAVRGDWEAWRPKLSPRAVVLFHDTNVRERGFGVWRLWQELAAEFPHFEFLHEHGLGVLAPGPDAPADIRALCALPDDRTIGAVRQRFALLGERWIESNERRGNIAAQQKAEASLAGALDTERRLEATIRAREAALAGAEANVLSIQAERDRLGGSERDLTTALANADARVEQLAAELSDTRFERDQARSALAIPAPEIATLAQMQQVLAQREAELTGLRQRLNTVVTSRAWRVTAPARQLGARFPTVTRTATRAAGFGVAALTGQLPGRLRLRQQVRADAATLQGTPLFDPTHYAGRYPEVGRSGADPLWHYIWTGAAAGYDPHPLFSSRWYLEQHPELAAAQVNPLAHYLREGATAGYDPHPLFDTAHYLQQEPEAAANPLLHFIVTGAARASNPNAFFDTDGYWNEYLRGRDLSDDPLSHYILRGAAAGNDPHASFDTDWYAATYPESAGQNPLVHYLREGQAKGNAPCLVLLQTPGEPRALDFRTDADPAVSIVVPVYGRLFDTLRCLTAIQLHSGGIPLEIIVADDRPDAPIAPRLREIPGLRVEQNPRNLGFLRSCNRAAELATAPYIVFLNNDTAVHPGWLEPLLRLADSDPRIGLVGARLLNADGTIQEAGGIIHRKGWGYPYGKGDDADRPEYGFVREVDVVIGACMLVRTTAWTQVGGFDDRYAPAYYEEFDLAFTLRDQGWRVMYQPASQVTHFDSASYGAAERDRQSSINHAQFCRKWAKALLDQPRMDAPLYLARERPRPGHILIVDDRIPEPDKHAGAIATYDWLRLLQGLGFRVTFAPHYQARPEPYTTNLQQMGVEVLHGAIDLPGWIAAHGAHLDWVWLARPVVAEPLLESVRQHAPGKLIYFTHDLHFLREQRRFELEGDVWHRDEARRLRRLERDIFRQARRVLTPSADEVTIIRELAPAADVRAIPLYTVPATIAVVPDDFAARHAVLFVGGYDHPPNTDAARWLADEIMPLVWQTVPDAVLVLAGSKPPKALQALASDRIEVPGWLPDLAPLYARARLSLNALRYGAGVKGKIIASLHAGVPVVTTPVGNEGLGLEPGEAALVGATAADLAGHAISLLQDAALCARMAEHGAAFVRDRFGEDVMRRALLASLDRALCPVCGHFDVAEQPVETCPSCGAGPLDRALAESALAPHRAAGVSSLREAIRPGPATPMRRPA